MAVGFLTLASCGEDTSDGRSADEPRLVVIPENTDEEMFGAVSATLGVNDKNCIVADGTVLVVGKGSRVVDKGAAVDIAGVGVVQVGEKASVAGGIIEGAADVKNFIDALGLGETVMECQEDAADPEIIVLDPAN